jgi:hypothetical protein
LLQRLELIVPVPQFRDFHIIELKDALDERVNSLRPTAEFSSLQSLVEGPKARRLRVYMALQDRRVPGSEGLKIGSRSSES